MTKRLSLDCSMTAYRQFDIANLTKMNVHIAELQLDQDKTWLYALDVRCGNHHWRVRKRYSQIREFWLALCELLTTETPSLCSERCHYLAGFEGDKFPKKRLLHTRTVLEGRANDFDLLFKRLAMRLALCNQRELTRCHFQGCRTVALLMSFFEIETLCIGKRGPRPYGGLKSYRSMPLVKNCTRDGKHTFDGRLSFSGIQETPRMA